MANLTITLYVNTSRIDHKNVDRDCNFGQSGNVPNEDYTSRVNVGDTVTWQGVSSTNVNDKVNINRINYQGNSNIFGRSVIEGSGDPETVTGLVEQDTGGDEETYTIFFSVLNSGNPRPPDGDPFHIDPKIQVHS